MQSIHTICAAAAMGLELYLDLLSQPCRATYIFAKKNGIPFQMHTVNIIKGQNVSEQFTRVNCLRKLPVLKDGNFVLTESSAILIYLSSKYQVADHWYPADLQARARVHEYLGWHADNIRGVFGVLLWSKVLGPLIGIQIPEEKMERNRKSMVAALQRLEEKFLGDRAFLTGQQMTLADLMCLEELMQPVALGYNLFEGRPQLTAWRNRVEAFLGADLCQEAHGTIMSILEQSTKKALPVPPPEAHPGMQLRIARIP
ncbi:glutathione S-transferase theta-2-like [Onychomys torridus]|uniref:glutathione S-transferase theta-2-like n=1 Tax=Onychomys torridus TaxID=38674 RepID=UPI00167F8609|nr:glutathione S-transferase theta-2-like [Onychomys torridus]